MTTRPAYDRAGLDALRRALAEVLAEPALSLGTTSATLAPSRRGRLSPGWVLASSTGAGTTDARPHGPHRGTGDAAGASGGSGRVPQQTGPGDRDDAEDATSSVADPTEAARLIALVEQAREGDADAFGALFDHYHPQIYRFVYYRTGSVPLAEDLTSEAFVRALRNITGFTWQGKDFGAWLTTIARNLVTDHFKSARSRLEQPTEDSWVLDAPTDGPESAVLAQLTNETLLEVVRTLPEEQQTCIVMRFLQGHSIAEVASALGRSDGAVKQLQLRAVRNLAKRLPEGLR
ncbi:sigma-70 family RNA polymerase sigma factor [Nocardioidaceae bacterium]|nr:sigma-70 family RNA polymerase sigma factor [Nocardioidaceae bacterium]